MELHWQESSLGKPLESMSFGGKSRRGIERRLRRESKSLHRIERREKLKSVFGSSFCMSSFVWHLTMPRDDTKSDRQTHQTWVWRDPSRSPE